MYRYRCFFFWVLLTLCVPAQANSDDWFNMNDPQFAQTYAGWAFSENLTRQSEFAWMLFARVNRSVMLDGQAYRLWELWPDNLRTFSPGVSQLKSNDLLKKKRNGPVLQTIKAHQGAPRFNQRGAGEEVTRNGISYWYIVQNKLTTRAGVKKYLSRPGQRVDLPIGAIEIKADWRAIKDVENYRQAYVIYDDKKNGYALVGLHIMMKIEPVPKDVFISESPSWFWTSFEFNDNPGLKNARSLITYGNQANQSFIDSTLKTAKLNKTKMINYSSNGTQIRFSDSRNPAIILGNTTMEDFAGFPNPVSADTPAKPATWVSWISSCHACHATASANVSLDPSDENFFYPFTVQTGKLPVNQLKAYQSLDFIWSIPFRTPKP